MGKRSAHVPKTQEKKRAYWEEIEKRDYEPTVNDGLDFRRTNQTGQDLTPQDTPARRPVSWQTQVKVHLRKHWVTYAASIGTGIVFLLAVTLQIAVGKMSVEVENQKNNLERIRVSGREEEKLNQHQETQLAQMGAKMDGVVKTVDEIKLDLREVRRDVQAATAQAHVQSKR